MGNLCHLGVYFALQNLHLDYTRLYFISIILLIIFVGEVANFNLRIFIEDRQSWIKFRLVVGAYIFERTTKCLIA